MKDRERIDPLIIAHATVVDESRSKELEIVRDSIFDNLNMVGAMMQPFLPMLSDAIRNMKIVKQEETSAKHLFSGYGLLAAKCREIAALNYILDGDAQKYEAAQTRIAKLFDYREWLSRDSDYKLQTRFNLVTSGMMALINRQTAFVSEFEFPQTLEPRIHLVRRNPSHSSDFLVSMTNKYGITFEVSKSGLDYFHANESEKVHSNHPLFDGDIELVMDYFTALFDHYGLTLENYSEKDQVGRYRETLLQLFKWMVNAVDPVQDTVFSTELDVPDIKLRIELAAEQGRMSDGKGYFLIIKSKEVYLTLYVEVIGKETDIKYQSHSYPSTNARDYDTEMSRQMRMKRVLDGLRFHFVDGPEIISNLT